VSHGMRISVQVDHSIGFCWIIILNLKATINYILRKTVLWETLFVNIFCSFSNSNFIHIKKCFHKQFFKYTNFTRLILNIFLLIDNFISILKITILIFFPCAYEYLWKNQNTYSNKVPTSYYYHSFYKK